MDIRVGVIDGESVTRASLGLVIAGVPGFSCGAVCASATVARVAFLEYQPDVVLMDCRFPGTTEGDCVALVHRSVPKAQIVILTAADDAATVFACLRAGASGYLLKGVAYAEILRAIAEVHAGGSPMSPPVARRVVESLRVRRDGDGWAEPMLPVGGNGVPLSDRLSDRECQVLVLLASGARDKEIAVALGISFETVRTHVGRIFGKLKVGTRTEAAARFHARNGVLMGARDGRDGRNVPAVAVDLSA